MKSSSVQVGADYRIGDWVVGGAFNYTDGDVEYRNGSGSTDAYGFAAYGTWLAENGMFVDLIGKYSRLSNDFEIENMKGTLDNNAWSVSAEFGWRFDLNSFLYVEPQAEVTYGRIFGDDATASNGVRIDQDDFDSLIGRVGLRAGLKFPENKGSVYARVSGVHDFKGESDAVYSKDGKSASIHDDIGGSWVEYAVGANFNFTPSTYTYVDLERTSGGEVKENWRWNLGLRTVF